MARALEIVSRNQFRNLNAFLVRLVSRTTHIHKEYELGVVLDGSVELRLEKDDIYLVNPLDAHEFLSSGRGALLLSIQISPKLFESFLSQVPGLRFGGSPKLRDHFAQRTILDISVSSGFSDVRYLTRLFQERFGCTPREYRSTAKRPKKRTHPLWKARSISSPSRTTSCCWHLCTMRCWKK